MTANMTVKILVVDDEPDLESLVRQRFRKQVRDKVYAFAFAQNGAEAIKQIENDPETELVLTDINMPVMDGLTLLIKLLELNPIIQPVVVSAYSDMKNIRTAMNRGAFDFLTKPIDFEDFEITITNAHMTFSMAYVTVIINSRLATFDTALEEAAMDLGARPVKVFFVITLPIIFPAILSGWLLAFTLSWDDLVISSFTSGPGSSTLPMVVFSKVRLGVSPEINVLATLTLGVVSTMIVGVSLWLARRARLDKAAP